MIVLEGSQESVKQKIEQYREADFQLEDGITPPMKDARNRRFGKKQAENIKRMQEVERIVKRLLEDDEKSISSNYTLFNSQNKPVKLKETGKRVSIQQQDTITNDAMSETEALTQTQEQADESGDSDFAAELEDDLLDDQFAERPLDTLELASEEKIVEETMAPETAVTEVDSSQSSQSAMVLQLQKQIYEKKALLSSVTNPAIRARIEDAVRYLEDKIKHQ